MAVRAIAKLTLSEKKLLDFIYHTSKLKEELRKTADEIARTAEEVAPRDTGALALSHTVVERKGRHANPYFAVEAKVPYSGVLVVRKVKTKDGREVSMVVEDTTWLKLAAKRVSRRRGGK